MHLDKWRTWVTPILSGYRAFSSGWEAPCVHNSTPPIPGNRCPKFVHHRLVLPVLGHHTRDITRGASLCAGFCPAT